MITFYCTNCNERIVVDDAKAGKAHVCPLCNKTLRVPGGQTTAVVAAKPEPVAPPATAPPQQPVYAQPLIYPQGPQQQPTVVVIQQPAPSAEPAPAPRPDGERKPNVAHPLATALLMGWVAIGLLGAVIGVFCWAAEMVQWGDTGAGMLGASLGMGLLGMLCGGIWLLVGIPVVVFWMVSRR